MKSKHKLTNKDIFDNYQECEFYLSQDKFVSAFAYWVIIQSERIHIEFYNLSIPLTAFHNYIHIFFKSVKKDYVQKFSFKELETILNSDNLANIPDIFALNQTKPDFIDLGALSRNVLYMIAREEITRSF